MYKTKILTSLILLALLAGCGVVDTAKQANQTGTDFMTALKDGQFQVAYDLFTEALQTEVGPVESLQQMIDDNAARPKEWTFSSWNMSTDADGNVTAKVEGTVNFQDGKQGTVSLELLQVGEEWQLLSFNLNW